MLLLYISAAFDALNGFIGHPIGILVIGAKVGAGYGIANEKKWGYQLGVAVSIVVIVGALSGVFPGGIISLLFDVLLAALLLHQQSREHQRIWFS